MTLSFFQSIFRIGALACTCLVLAFSHLATGCLGCGAAPQPEASAPNVVLILIDTLRADWIHALGHPAETSPNIDRLARVGVVFEQANAAAPWTPPSVASLFTSTFVAEHNVIYDKQKLSPKIQTLAEYLARSGYVTASFFRNPYAGPMSGLDRGFDQAIHASSDTGRARVAKWLASISDRPFFLYVHNTRPHDPQRAEGWSVRRFGTLSQGIRRKVTKHAKRYRALTRVDFVKRNPLGTTDNTAKQKAQLASLQMLRPDVELLYSGTVLEADADVGGIIAALKQARRWDNTLCIVLADHGEEMGEHGGWQHDQSVYEELVHVPLVIRLPGDEHAGLRIPQPVSLVDVAPTILEAIGRPELARDRMRGRSLFPLIRSEAMARDDEPRVTAVRYNKKKYFRPWKEQRGDINVVVRQGRWKGILNVEPGSFELYDLESDPREQQDVSGLHQEIGVALRDAAVSQYGEFVAARVESSSGNLSPLDPGTAAALRSLGYLGGESDPTGTSGEHIGSADPQNPS